VLRFLAYVGRDPAVRKEVAARGRAYLGLGKTKEKVRVGMTPELAGLAIRIAAEEGGGPVVDALVAELATERGDVERRRVVLAIGSAYADAKVAERARALELDARLRPNETGLILAMQMRRAATRDAAWRFFAENVEKIVARMPPAYATSILNLATPFCDKPHKDELEKLFAPRIASIEGGPRALAGVLEEMTLCIARRAAHEPEARALFAKKVFAKKN